MIIKLGDILVAKNMFLRYDRINVLSCRIPDIVCRDETSQKKYNQMKLCFLGKESNELFRILQKFSLFLREIKVSLFIKSKSENQFGRCIYYKNIL